MKFHLLALTGSLLLTAPAAPAPAAALLGSKPVGTAPDHRIFDALLKKHVDRRGRVSYKGFLADQRELNRYLELLSQHPPTAEWSRKDQMAFWINAYNAYTIRLILDHYPVQSIKDIGSKIQIPLVTTPWAARFFRIGGEKMSLDDIEHGTLRKHYNDPRVHFALVCASVSCPPLRNEAYTAARLEQQLEQQGRLFLNDPTKNRIARAGAQLSRYFDWYKGDWNQNGQSVVKWVNRYSATRLEPGATITFLDYDWRLNEQ
ncbi:DUF547 domain-containing protein [Hymenobacter psychrotolerans]|uniref:DUF547 domain-containing protein n=1 Tax=Hymenobacter psychrotolerans DSM 18569 TaxID=1121959 RepID=A0A1M7FG71_9BACT|nr:DUF547 domain-containing protein [Hymenobacter psychrotolerans]SHM02963.1 Protein of unknown function, DUF547 [Hymenobacter psychrotolerans DSM 18569]